MAIDLVDKQRVIEAFNCEINITGKKNAEAVVDAIKGIADRIKALPVVEPRAKGEWITNGYGAVICSKCNWPAPMIMTGCLVNRHLEYDKSDFCWHCGADMREEKDGG